MAFEKSIQKTVIDYLNSLDQCRAENVSGNSSQRGRPDINCCWRGRAVRIELKTKDNYNKESNAQKINLKKWSRAGAVCFVAYSLKDVKCIINNEGTVNLLDFKGVLYTNFGGNKYE